MNAIPLRAVGPATLINRTPVVIIEELRAAKAREEAARKERVAAEEELVEALRAAGSLPAKDEGSKTLDVENYKVKVTNKLTRKLVGKGAEGIKALDLGELTPLKTKVELDDAGCKWLRDNDPEIYAKLAAFIETKPAKTAVEITRKD